MDSKYARETCPCYIKFSSEFRVLYVAYCLCMVWLGYQLKVGPVWCFKQVWHMEQPEDIFFSRHFLCNHSAVDMDVFGYDNVNVPKKHIQVWHIPPKALYI